MPKISYINTPLTKDVVRTLRAGDHVLFSGTLYAARDAAHKRITEALSQGNPLPISLKDQIIYYVGPSPAKPGEAIGSAGPTTAGRMDIYTPPLLEHGVTGMIGKGQRSQEVIDAIQKYEAVYFSTISGAGALLSKKIVKYTVIDYPELGAEALASIEVKEFPAIVTIDSLGNNLYLEGPKQYLSEKSFK